LAHAAFARNEMRKCFVYGAMMTLLVDKNVAALRLARPSVFVAAIRISDQQQDQRKP
jgi:hypothetical protein